MNSRLRFSLLLFAIGLGLVIIALRSDRSEKPVGLRAKIKSFATDPDDDQMGRTFFVGSLALIIGIIALIL